MKHNKSLATESGNFYTAELVYVGVFVAWFVGIQCNWGAAIRCDFSFLSKRVMKI